MSLNGGVYGDYEVVKSTRVLEGRRLTSDVYNRRIRNARGGYTNYFLTSSFFGASYLLAGSYFGFACSKSKLLTLLTASATALVSYNIFVGFIGNPTELTYLKSNKKSVLEEIYNYQLHDQLERNEVFPTKPVEAAAAEVEEVSVAEEAE